MKPRFWLSLAILVCMIGSVSAAPFTNVFQNTTHVIQNQTFVHSSTNTTALPFWIFITFLGLVFLAMSALLKQEQGIEMWALLAPIPLLISAWQSRAIEYVTSYGAVYGNIGSDPTFVMLENHTIYSEISITIVMGIIFLVSLLNVYRVLVVVPRLKAPQEVMQDE